MQNSARFMFLAAFLLSGVMVREADAQSQPDPRAAMCPEDNPACNIPEDYDDVGSTTIVTFYQGPKWNGEEPGRFKSRRDFALRFLVFVKEAKISPARAQGLLYVLYDYQEKQLTLLKPLREMPSDLDWRQRLILRAKFCRQNPEADKLTRQNYATLEKRLRSMLTWEEWDLWEKWCSECPYLVAGWSYDKRILKLSTEAR